MLLFLEKRMAEYTIVQRGKDPDLIPDLVSSNLKKQQ